MSIKIDRCICYNVTFEEIKKLMNEKHLKTIEDIQMHIEVSQNCKLCRPYILKMIDTGQTVFHEIISE